MIRNENFLKKIKQKYIFGKSAVNDKVTLIRQKHEKIAEAIENFKTPISLRILDELNYHLFLGESN